MRGAALVALPLLACLASGQQETTEEDDMITTTEPECITLRRAELNRELAELDGLTAPVETVLEIFGDAGTVRLSRIGSRVSVDINVDDLEEVVPYLRELAARGYHATKGHEIYEDDSKTFRCYNRGKIQVWAYLTGNKCHRVQVGTKEVPVYRIQCGEGA